ncbi:polyprenyl synthetase [Methylophaga lonarensis MPL]|uniref:Polyprenyl synthetase n=2 Tax=Methylophaga lonarensis TaxID=999151 RepID=M7PIW8_9GAMM|nr:farnesyl diphosphate synthase [Methylophaga lonarensis]EMR13815.1 polyprenyl synthetase [Methylophaga lonarensis MPL]
MTQIFALNDWMLQHQQQVELALQQRLADRDSLTSLRLLSAMRYSTLDGGKRFRALLVYATGQALAAPDTTLDAAAAAVEMIHAYSLVHDDMPIMDNDDLRRGRPTCHKAYDDATALLVGDALQTLAFETLCDDEIAPVKQARMVKTLAQAAGAFGMAGGQAIDLESVGKTLDLNALQTMHQLKTGALIRAAVALGAQASDNYDATQAESLDRYAAAIGLAFQVQDDVLDVTADTQTLGKTQGADIALNKPTYPALLGLEQARQKAQDLIAEAISAVESLAIDSRALVAIAHYVIKRAH